MRGLSTLLISPLKDSTLMMVGVKTLVQMVSSMSLLEFAAQWMVTAASLWSCSEESHCPFLPGPFGCHANNHFRSLGAFFLQTLGLSCGFLQWPHIIEQPLILSAQVCPSCGILVSCAPNQGYGRSRYHLVLTNLVSILNFGFSLAPTLCWMKWGHKSPSLYVPICFPHYLGAF